MFHPTLRDVSGSWESYIASIKKSSQVCGPLQDNPAQGVDSAQGRVRG